MRRIGLGLVAAAASLAAQTFTFEVASVKQSQPDQPISGITTERGIFKVDNMPLRSLVSYALNVQADLVSGGPSWAADLRFDISAKNERSEEQDVPDSDRNNLAARDARTRARVRQLLEERFKLKLRQEVKETQVYALSVEKSGSKLKVATTPKGNMSVNRSNLAGGIHGEGVGIAKLCTALSSVVQRPVIDETGLTDVYDIELRYSYGEDAQPAEDQSIPSVFTAIREQLGLRLTGRKAPVTAWVIESAEKPGAN
ncbi:MAG: hypothetical protein JWN34_2450 [Bryobacterales bacterium]|nr:hypothetical protein [Bryobacterales bacterium]